MTVLAKILWLKPDEGGRVAPPRAHRYSTVVKFESQTGEQWLKDAWSLVLDLEGTPDETWTQTAWVHFLAVRHKRRFSGCNLMSAWRCSRAVEELQRG
jgi:hypothetical protein